MRFIQSTGLLIPLLYCITACNLRQTPPTPFPTYTPYPTYTPFPTYTPLPTYTPALAPQGSEVRPRAGLSSTAGEELLWPTGPRDDVISFTDAASFIGQKLTVEGTVLRTYNSGNVVFLNFAEDFANTFTAVIFPDDWSKFSAPPEDLFYGKLVRIEGVIEEYQGTPEIIITEPWQIEVALIHGQPVITDCNCQEQSLREAQEPALLAQSATQPASTAQLEPPPPPATTEPQAAITTQPQIIPWEDAAAYQGQTMTVEGQIISTYNSGNVVFLNFDKDFQNTFTVAIFPDAWPLFPAPPEEYYANKRIRVTGLIKMYQNSPEIIVDNPNQIEIME